MKYKVTLKGVTYEVEVEHGEAMLLDEYEAAAPVQAAPAAAPVAVVAAPAAAPAAPVAVAAGIEVKAPLPGSILTINCKVGDTIKKGDQIMIIEAMKMENEVLAGSDGVVKQILVSKGQIVATDDVLVVI